MTFIFTPNLILPPQGGGDLGKDRFPLPRELHIEIKK
jgi:hypothetical protein